VAVNRPDWTVLKLGGELLEDTQRMQGIACAIAHASRETRLVVVHGGGREVDAALARAALPKRQVDGLRITDPDTLAIVIEVLAGAVNTRFVAAINAAGAAAVGLTGADARLALVKRSEPHVGSDGRVTDLGRVGHPVGRGVPPLLEHLAAAAYVPVVASIGIDEGGALYNVNADTLAAHMAGRLAARQLIIAGATAGVLDAGGRTIPALDREARRRLIASGVASAGMVAKLRACEEALALGAGEVLLVDGRDLEAIAAALTGTTDGPSRSTTTRMVA
jgi:acetylglutamate kinase